MFDCKRCGEEMKDLGDLFGFRCPCCEPGLFVWDDDCQPLCIPPDEAGVE